MCVPGNVCLHALRVVLLLALCVEVLRQVVWVQLARLGQAEVHDAWVILAHGQAVTNHTQLQRRCHRLQQLQV